MKRKRGWEGKEDDQRGGWSMGIYVRKTKYKTDAMVVFFWH